jgi:hypothetical protein
VIEIVLVLGAFLWDGVNIVKNNNDKDTQNA